MGVGALCLRGLCALAATIAGDRLGREPGVFRSVGFLGEAFEEAGRGSR
jgi:hypothetical protein